jgi:hypothetical protein
MKYLFLFFCLQFGMFAYSQHVFIDSVDKKAFSNYDFEHDLIRAIMTSPIWKDINIEGDVYLYFTVDTLGKICNVNIIKGFTKLFDKVAITDNLYRMPKWIPAEYKGKKVESIVYLTIRIYMK